MTNSWIVVLHHLIFLRSCVLNIMSLIPILECQLLQICIVLKQILTNYIGTVLIEISEFSYFVVVGKILYSVYDFFRLFQIWFPYVYCINWAKMYKWLAYIMHVHNIKITYVLVMHIVLPKYSSWLYCEYVFFCI